MNRGLTGHFVPVSTLGEQCRAFVPGPLPPAPPLILDDELNIQLQEAFLSVGRLDGQIDVLPAPDTFVYSYVRKEAVLTSQIEDTQSTLNELLAHELEQAPGLPTEDVREVSCYVAALELGMQRLAEGLPVSLRLITELHGQLLSSGRGSTKQPGEFRRSQNWIGGTRPGNARHVPPPPDMVLDCMGALEKFIHNDPVKTNTLIKAALAHVQFETIHPFLDGNGRLGRLLIALILSSEGMLRQPMLYLSLYFKQHRSDYYAHLQNIRETGDWEVWLSFFLRGVKETAEDAALTARRLWSIFRQDREKLQLLPGATGSLLQAQEQLQRVPLLSASKAAAKMNVSLPTATKAMQRLQTLGIVREITGGKYGRLYAYDAYLSILSEGTEPLRG
jgi:Fic family protein